MSSSMNAGKYGRRDKSSDVHLGVCIKRIEPRTRPSFPQKTRTPGVVTWSDAVSQCVIVNKGTDDRWNVSNGASVRF